MAELIVSGITSLDGYIADADGNFDWAEPDEEVFAFVNGLERSVGTYLFGRRMYETMVYWETATDGSAVEREFAEVWRGADKVVYSTTLDTVSSARTRLERRFDPEAVHDLVESADRNVAIAGPTLAAHAFRAGLVTEILQFVNPVIVGGGLRFLPDDVRLPLDLIEERRFEGGVVFLRYRVRREARPASRA